MDLVVGKTITANRQLHGSEIVSGVAAGKSFTVETSPNGSDILNETVPAGKKWEIRVDVHIIETNA